MTNTFQTLQEDYKYSWGDNVAKAGTIFFTTKYYGTIQHASSKESQGGSKASDMVIAPSTDRELLKAWHHATIERKYGVYASKELLKKELEVRGYILVDGKHRWKKPETVNNADSTV